MTDWLRLYHQSPYLFRSLAASLRGYYLRSWRYGSETERLVEDSLARESWSPDEWKHWHEERLAFVLHRAATQVQYYRDHWAMRRRNGDRASWEILQNWDILEKEPLRQNPRAFVADDCDTRRMFHEHMSGTTGKSLDLWWSKATVRAWFALFEARCRRWHQVSRNDRWAILGGQLVVPVSQTQPPFWVWNAALNQLYLSSYHLSPQFIPAYLDALAQYRIRYLWGYTSSLYALAIEVLRLGRTDLKMTVALTNAEPVFDYQRQAIAQAFQCPVRETYGMAEIVAAASECEQGRLYLWDEVGVVETWDGDVPTHETPGDLICTGLLNADMPLIRYRTGDRGALSAHGDKCECGRTLRMLASVEGRSDDALYTVDGRHIGRLAPVFKTHLPVIEAQIIQESLREIRVRYVPANDFTPEAGESMAARLRERMGPVEVRLESVK
jgi:phenylacetate-CoA ligase